MSRYSKLLLTLFVGFVGTGGCASDVGDSSARDVFKRAEIQLQSEGISADIAVYPGGNSFTSNVVVTNTGTQPTTNWEVDIELNNGTLVGTPWNSAATQSGTIITLRPLSASNNAVLAPGASAYPGFTGQWPNTPYVNPTIVAVRRDVNTSGSGGAGSGGSVSSTGSGGTITGGSTGSGGISENAGATAVGGETFGGTSSGGSANGGTSGGGGDDNEGGAQGTSTSAAGGSSANNVALDRTATASSSLSTGLASYANDSNNSSSWCASSSTLNEWWMVDLGVPYNLSRTEVTWPQAERIYQYAIDVSEDGSIFTEVVDRRANTDTTQTLTDSFSAIGRYVRLTVTGLASNPVTSACISDFKVFGVPIPTNGSGGAGGTSSGGSGTIVSSGGVVISTDSLSSSGGNTSGGSLGLGGVVSTGGTSSTGGSSGEVDPNSEEFYLQLASNLSPEQIALASYGDGGNLVISDGVKLAGATSGFATVSSLGANTWTDLGVNTEVNDVFSAGNVFVRGSHVHGDIVTSGSFVPNPQFASQIDGATNEHASLDPIRRISWKVKFTPGAESISLWNEESQNLTPGAYGSITLGKNSHLTLSRGGVYILNGSLTMEPGSVLTVENTTTQVELYVRESFYYRGSIQKAAAKPNFIIGVAGNGDVPLDRPFDAILIAPHGSVQLATSEAGHFTSIFAKSILVRPNTVVTQEPFDPTAICETSGAARGGLCANDCEVDGDCAAGLTCHSGICGCSFNSSAECGVREPCSTTSDCQVGLTCVSGATARYGLRWDKACTPISCVLAGPNGSNSGSVNDFCGIASGCASPSGCLPSFHLVPGQDADDNSEKVAGTIAASFEVTEAGTASYSIPISLPPGRAGMTPTLGLVYDSSSSEELLGAGWMLSGYSYITRCATPAGLPSGWYTSDYPNGGPKRRGLRGDENDQLCLDGKPLARQPSLDGDNGGLGYTTATDSFKRIRAYKGTGANAEYFKVWTPDGRILTYGSSDGSLDANVLMALKHSGKSARTRVWALSRAEDQVGNYIEYTYHKNEGGSDGKGATNADSVCSSSPTLCGTTEIWPESISYTGFKDEAPTRKVSFGYESAGRPLLGQLSTYVAGVQTFRTQLLKQIDVSINDETVKSIVLNYVHTNGDVYEVQSISECANGACKQPTNFEYYGGVGLGPAIDAGFSMIPSFESYPDSQFIVWDQDGDGLDDLITAQMAENGFGGQWIKIKSSNNGAGGIQLTKQVSPFFQGQAAQSQDSGLPNDIWRNFEQSSLVDINGDGSLDLVDTSSRWNTPTSAISGGASPSEPWTEVQTKYLEPKYPELDLYIPGGGCSTAFWSFLDVDGDGPSDAVYSQRGVGNLGWRRNSGRGYFEPLVALNPQISSSDPRLYWVTDHFPVDLDGDGALDVVGQVEMVGGNRTRILNWEKQPEVPMFVMGGNYMAENTLPVDVNGDGLKDMLIRIPPEPTQGQFTWGDGLDLRLYMNTGKGFPSFVTVKKMVDYFEFKSMRVIDYDADGRDDILMWDRDAEKWIGWRGVDGNLEPFVVSSEITRPGAAYFENNQPQQPKFYWTVVADLNGDHANDLLIVRRDGQVVYHLGNTAKTHRLKSVTDGLGKRIDVEYDGGPLANRAYQRGGNSPTAEEFRTHTRLLNRTAQPLVFREKTSKRDGDAFVLEGSATYFYQNARVDGGGRGWLGFDRRTITKYDADGVDVERTFVEYDKNTILRKYPECIDTCDPGTPGIDSEPYHYPYAGLPTRTETEYLIVDSSHSLDGYRQLNRVVEFDWSHYTGAVGLNITGRGSFPHLIGQKTTVVDSSVRNQSPRTISATEERFEYDASGNNTLHETWSFTGTNRTEHSVVSSTYVKSDKERWILRLPDVVTVKRTRGTTEGSDIADFDGEESSRITDYDYDSLGQLSEIRRDGSAETTPDLVTPDLKVTYKRNKYGNVERIVRSAGSTVAERVTVVDQFDVDNIYPVSVTEQPDSSGPNKHQWSLKFDQRFGNPSNRTDPNDLVESWNHDGFGRLTSHTAPDGSGEAISYEPASASDGVLPVAAVFRTVTNNLGGGKSTQEVDSLGRVVRNTSLGVKNLSSDGSANPLTIVQEREFDSRGRLRKVARPHASGDSSQGVIEYSYNDLNELIAIDNPDATTERFDYIEVASMSPEEVGALDLGPHDAYAVFHTDARNAVDTRTFDNTGHLVTSIAADNGRVSYEYDGFGNARFVRAPNNFTTENRYDSVGRLYRETNPDRGLHRYWYNGFDEVVTHTMPRVNDTTARRTESIDYDDYGRVELLENDDGIRRWVYDQSENGIGQLSAEYVDVGGNTSVANSKTYAYDTKGRARKVTQRVQGKDYDVTVDYTDLGGRLKSVIYPGIGDAHFKVENVYDPTTGVLIEVRDAELSSNQYWKLEETYQGYLPSVERVGTAVKTTKAYEKKTGLLKQVKSEVNGNVIQDESYTFNENHNLRTRTDNLSAGSAQTFEYDSLNRLTRVRAGLNADSPVVEAIDYDVAGTGNILTKTGLGVYDYGDPYGERPHAVKSTNGGARTYAYDNAGNQISRTGGPLGDQTLKYTLFGLPYEIRTRSANVANVTNYEYGTSGERVAKHRSVLSNPNDPNSERIPESFRIYVGDLYEVRGSCPGGGDSTCADPSRTHVYRVYGGGREVAQIHRDEEDGQNVTAQRTYFLHSDQIGSTVLVTAGDDNSPGAPTLGTVLKTQRYSPFGKATETLSGAGAVSTGFTGLEEDSDEGLVNANGRIYDAELGRFLSPDPFTPFGGWSQGHNQYSYALNNPLNFADRSGFQAEPSGPQMQYGPPPPPVSSREIAPTTFPGDEERKKGYTYVNGGVIEGSPHGDPGQPGSNDGAKPSSAQPTQVSGRDRAAQGIAASHSERGAHAIESRSGNGSGNAPNASHGYSVPYSGLEDAVLLHPYRTWVYTTAAATTVYYAAPAAYAYTVEAAEAALLSYVRSNNLLLRLLPVLIAGGPTATSKGVTITRNWIARSISDPSVRNGCEKVAVQILKIVGGNIQRIVPKDAPTLGGFMGQNPGWAWHEVVVNEGRVFDAFTGAQGMLIAEYKALWQYADAIKFGF